MDSSFPPTPPQPPSVPPMPPSPPGYPPPGMPPSAGPPWGSPPAGGPPPDEPKPPLPFEQPGYPFLEGLFETAKLFITQPSEAFARMSLTGDLGKPILYAVICSFIGMAVAQIYSVAFSGMMLPFLRDVDQGAFHLTNALRIGIVIASPIFTLIGIFIGAAILHLFLMIVGGANTGFTSTVRVVCYSGTVQILQIVPFCGGLIAGIWSIVLHIIGLATAHRTTQGKAAAAVLLPIALCCVCAVLAIVIFGFSIAGLAGKLR